jgi:hypothetical protein
MTRQPLRAPCAREGCPVIRVQKLGQSRSHFERIDYCCHECSSIARRGPKRKRKSKRGRPLAPRVCVSAECGKTFQPTRKDQRACSEKCRKRAGQFRPPVEFPWKGGIAKGGGLIVGTLSLTTRPEVDLSAIPEGEGRYWT